MKAIAGAVLYFGGAVALLLVLPESALRFRTTRWAFEPERLLGYYRRYATIEDVLGRDAGTQESRR